LADTCQHSVSRSRPAGRCPPIVDRSECRLRQSFPKNDQIIRRLVVVGNLRQNRVAFLRVERAGPLITGLTARFREKPVGATFPCEGFGPPIETLGDACAMEIRMNGDPVPVLGAGRRMSRPKYQEPAHPLALFVDECELISLARLVEHDLHQLRGDFELGQTKVACRTEQIRCRQTIGTRQWPDHGRSSVSAGHFGIVARHTSGPVRSAHAPPLEKESAERWQPRFAHSPWPHA